MCVRVCIIIIIIIIIIELVNFNINKNFFQKRKTKLNLFNFCRIMNPMYKMTLLMINEPDVIDNLLKLLERGAVTEATKWLEEKIVGHCHLMYYEPKWRVKSYEANRSFYSHQYFWEVYQNLVKNVEAFIIHDLTFKLATMHGIILAEIDECLKESKNSPQWGAVPFNRFRRDFDLFHLKHTSLMMKLLQTPKLYSTYLKRQVESTLMTNEPSRYCVEFCKQFTHPNDPPQRNTLLFCFTTYLSLPSQLKTSRGLVRFHPAPPCAKCERDSPNLAGVKHLWFPKSHVC